MFTFDLIQCGLLVLGLMVAGEVISHKMKAVIPSILASAVLFVALLWSGILPKDLVETSGLMHLTTIAMMFTIIGMGASLNLQELLANWRVVVLAASSYLGQILILLLVISALFGRNIAIGSLPGGAAVALIIQEQARALGLDQIVVLSVLLVSIQGLIACPIVSWMLRMEVLRIQKSGIQPAIYTDSCSRTSGKTDSSASAADDPVSSAVSEKAAKQKSRSSHQSPYWSLLRFYVVAWAASRLDLYTGISRYVFCLLLGVLFVRIGFLSRNEMERSKSQGILSLMMMINVLNGFSALTPEMFGDLLLPVVCILLTDIISIFILSMLFGKLLHFSRPMGFALSLNVMIGFPLNLMLAQDIVDFLAKNESEKALLNQQIASRMVIGGFTSMTFLSTIGAGLLVNYFI